MYYGTCTGTCSGTRTRYPYKEPEQLAEQSAEKIMPRGNPTWATFLDFAARDLGTRMPLPADQCWGARLYVRA